MANTNGLTNTQVAQGYSTIPGAFDPVSGLPKAGATSSVQAPAGAANGTGVPVSPTTGQPLGLSSPNATTINNTSVNQTPDASSLTSTKPVVIPPAPQGTANAANASIANSQAALLSLQGNAQAYQDQRDQELGNTNSLINTYLGKGQDTLNQENALGVPNLRTAAQTANTQYTTSQLAYDTQYQQIMNAPGGTLEQKLGQIQDLQQQAAPGLAQQQISAALNQQQYTNAMDTINNAINLKYQPIKDSIDFGMQFLQQNAGLLSQAQQQQFQAQLQVQTQTYDQGKFYSQLNATTGMDLLKQATANGAPKDVIDNMGQLISSGATPGQIASAAGTYATNGNFPMTWNPQSGQMEPYNQSTGQFVSGGTIPAGSQTYNVTDPNSGKITTASDGTQYAWGTYNQDPQYGMKVAEATSKITDQVGQITDAKTAQVALNNFAPTTNLTGNMIINAANIAGIDPTILMGHINQESLLGSSPVAQQNNNFGGLTYTYGQKSYMGVPVTQGSPRPASEGGYYMKFSTPKDGITAQAMFDATKKQTPPPSAPGQTNTTQNASEAFNTIKSSAPVYISKAMNIMSSTGNMYIDSSLLTDPNGSPSGSAQNLAASYQKMGFKIVGHDQALSLQDADSALIKINNIEDQWKAIAPSSYWDKTSKAGSDSIKTTFAPNSPRSLALTSYSALLPTAISTLNSITDSKRLSNFTSTVSENTLPVAPHAWLGGLVSSITFGLAAKGDTLQSGIAKLDNLRRDINASITPITGSAGAPLSSEIANNSSMPTQINYQGKNYSVDSQGNMTAI